jgi:hypothetical protein
VRGLGIVALLAGCNQLLGVGTIGVGDGDGGPGGPDAKQTCITGSLFNACFDTLPTTSKTISTSLNTDTDPRCETSKQAGGPDVCLIGGTTVTVGGVVKPTGSRPLVLFAVMDLEVTGMIDVSGDATAPAGTNTGPCLGGGAGADGANPSGGGGGGFGASAGAGGGGSLAGGSRGQMTALTFVRGGCPGGQGAGSVGGAPSVAGGSVYLMAGNSVSVDDTALIVASGQGGSGGGQSASGGAGGASGGLIGLDSPSVSVDGTLISCGGGGGAGGITGQAGSPGHSGSPSGAPGGLGSVGAGSGGDGGIDSTSATDGSVGSAGGGGGGGGSIGVIWLNATFATITGTITPDTTGP